MSSVVIKEQSGERLHLSLEPTPVTWALAIGALSFIFGYPLYSYDSFGLILMIWIMGTAGLLAFFNPWQEIILDKETRTIIIDRQNLYQRYNIKTPAPATYELENILAVNYELPNIVFTFRNYSTIDLSIKGDDATVAELVDKIQKFLQLDVKNGQVDTPVSEAGSLHLEATNEDSSDDSFERIETADLVEYESTRPGSECDIPSELIETLSPSPEEPEEFIPETEERLATDEPTEASADDPKPKSAGDSAATCTPADV